MVIMKNALWKDIFRDIKKSKGRFISIASIIALGVMLFAGVKIAPVNMKATADKYYDDYNLMDLRVVSTLGLTNEDVKDIKNIDGVLGVEPSKTLDVISKVDSDEFVIRVHSLPNDNLNDDNEDYINRLNLIEGHLPTKEGECVIAKENFSSLNLKIGDKLKLKSGDDSDIKDVYGNKLLTEVVAKSKNSCIRQKMTLEIFIQLTIYYTILPFQQKTACLKQQAIYFTQFNSIITTLFFDTITSLSGN